VTVYSCRRGYRKAIPLITTCRTLSAMIINQNASHIGLSGEKRVARLSGHDRHNRLGARWFLMKMTCRAKRHRSITKWDPLIMVSAAGDGRNAKNGSV
jgi:hypothetical protein